ncbi:helix-turn-helix domain-containing protein [Steroidobacter flavus]|uniref:Helix-turn-helix domain-containing protein n=1 Tax=Steroidobacter flavus TaxID=1842136 RepID=A0ABV8SQE1_9GAMM
MASVIGKRIKEARLRMKLSQGELGTQAGISADGASQRLSQYELGVHDPSFELVEKLAQVLGLPTPYFYAKEDQLADWILAFAKTSASKRRVIVEEAGVPSRKS